MKKIALLLCATMVMTSCAKTFYQVFTINSENAVYTSNGSPVYLNNGLEFTYNFWGENGNVRFIIYNSNDYDVIVDLTKSSFIRNNIAEDYYQERQYETRIATGVFKSSKYGESVSVNKQVGASTLVNYLGKTYDVALSYGASVGANTEVGNTVKKEWQTAIVHSEPEVVRIPAKSAKAFFTFNINSTRISSSRLKAEYYYDPIEFSKSTTPLEFRNRICIYKEGDEPSYYDMNFYIKEIGNVMSISGLSNPTSFYIPYSSRLENSDYNDELFESSKNSSSRPASSQFASTTTTQPVKSSGSELSGAALVDHYYRRIDKAVTGEELIKIKKEIEADTQKGKITQQAANGLYKQISKLLTM